MNDTFHVTLQHINNSFQFPVLPCCDPLLGCAQKIPCSATNIRLESNLSRETRVYQEVLQFVCVTLGSLYAPLATMGYIIRVRGSFDVAQYFEKRLRFFVITKKHMNCVFFFCYVD